MEVLRRKEIFDDEACFRIDLRYKRASQSPRHGNYNAVRLGDMSASEPPGQSKLVDGSEDVAWLREFWRAAFGRDGG